MMTLSAYSDFGEFFKKATGNTRYPYQDRFATSKELHQLMNIPTGLGKTAAVILGWLWRRRFAPEEVRRHTPRRLVYCLPMRVLVEQTHRQAVTWMRNLGILCSEIEADSYGPDFANPEGVTVHMLMGGEDDGDWDIYPEREAILIGTQDMLLSRLLNRGYAASRARWPMQFGLVNTDSLWVFDEIQLMGSGLATTSQMEAFRHLLPGKDAEATINGQGCRSVWLSATMQRDWLKTVDFAPRVDSLLPLELKEDDLGDPRIDELRTAKKPLAQARSSMMGETEKLADKILKEHKAGTRTIVVMNTVERARKLFDALKSAGGPRKKRNSGKTGSGQDSAGYRAHKMLLHSRFRPEDRRKQMDSALADIDQEGPGAIVVSTQVIEAGVDVSAAMLFTELAPWASLVQRFGRCNRRGEHNKEAQVFWVDLPGKRWRSWLASWRNQMAPRTLQRRSMRMLSACPSPPPNPQGLWSRGRICPAVEGSMPRTLQDVLQGAK
jgi:CRISPR-associated endonuclease/helicase Cas3